MSKNIDDLLNGILSQMDGEEFILCSYQGIIAAEIIAKRVSMKMNQKQFADYMGVSQGMVSKWEKGESNFTLQTLIRIANKLNIKMQCPFVLSPAPEYVSRSKTIDNIREFPQDKIWRGSSYTGPSYSGLTDAKEE